MDNNLKLRLKNLPKSRCFICKTPKSYTNPLAKCSHCGKKFCYSHITGGVEIKGQKDTEELKDLCDKCLSLLEARF